MAKKEARWAAIAVLSFLGTLQALAASTCDFNDQKEILRDDATDAEIVWTLRESADLRSAYRGGDARWESYASWVRSQTAWTAREILLNHIRVGERLIARLPESDPFRRSVLVSNRNAQQVASGQTGTLRPMSCLESLPLRELLKSVDLKKTGREFHGTVLRKSGAIKLLVNFSKVGGNSQSGSESERMARLRREHLAQGWELDAHYHNHPFAFDNPYGDVGGALCPSATDLATYLRGRYPSALISNGIDTLFLDEDEIRRFEVEN